MSRENTVLEIHTHRPNGEIRQTTVRWKEDSTYTALVNWIKRYDAMVSTCGNRWRSELGYAPTIHSARLMQHGVVLAQWHRPALEAVA